MNNSGFSLFVCRSAAPSHGYNPWSWFKLLALHVLFIYSFIHSCLSTTWGLVLICDETIHVLSNSAFWMQRNQITRDLGGGGHLHGSRIQNCINKELGTSIHQCLKFIWWNCCSLDNWRSKWYHWHNASSYPDLYPLCTTGFPLCGKGLNVHLILLQFANMDFSHVFFFLKKCPKLWHQGWRKKKEKRVLPLLHWHYHQISWHMGQKTMSPIRPETWGDK